MSEPSTQIYLYRNCIFDDTYKNCINFSNGSRSGYLASILARYFQNAMFIRKDSVYNVPVPVGEMRNINYIKYNNNDGGGDIYAFIINKKYINPSTTEITIKTDVFQTYLNDFEIKDSFVVREHVTDDTIGSNTVAENVTANETIINKSTNMLPTPIGTKHLLVVFSGRIPNDTYSPSHINGMPSASKYYIVDSDNIFYFVSNINGLGLTDAILSISYLPSVEGLNLSDNIAFGDPLIANCKTVLSSNNIRIGKSISMNTALNGYVPKNNKMFTFPYNYIEITDSESTVQLKYERFMSNSDIDFDLFIVLDNNVNAVVAPKNYEYDQKVINGIYSNYQHSLNYNKFPLIPYNYSVYKEYIAQNKNSLALSFMSDAMGIGTNVTGGNYLGAAGGVMSVANKMGSLADMKNRPLRQRQQNSDMTHYALNINIQINQVSLIKEYASIVDDYFTKFGYSTSEIKIPNVNGRPYYNYVETDNINVIGIPYEDLTEFKQIFNNGVTIWHSNENYLNYEVNNNV